MTSPLVGFVLRGFQALFAIVVLGLSVTLIRGHHWGNLPAVLGFSAFVGGLSFLAALVGLAGSFFSFLEGTIGLIIDGVVAVINIAGGIVWFFPSTYIIMENNKANHERTVHGHQTQRCEVRGQRER